MTWSELKRFASWTPLRQFPAPLHFLSDGLAMISDCSFFYVVPYNRQLIKTPEAPYITLLIWAQSPGAALRAMDRQIAKDDGSTTFQPPPELLLSPDSATYGSILRQARVRGDVSVMEHASYRIADDRAFIHRAISVGSEFEFYFRGRENDHGEKPYAIRYSERRVVQQARCSEPGDNPAGDNRGSVAPGP
jgi:hypothetical protein